MFSSVDFDRHHPPFLPKTAGGSGRLPLEAIALLLVAWITPASLRAQGSFAEIEIATARDARYLGVAAYDVTGRDVVAGDINHDGVDDLIIGARQSDPGGRTDAGRVSVFFGPLASGQVAIAAGADITVEGIDAGDHAGIGVAVGDINNDALPDLIVGARRADPGGREDAGEAYVIFGPLASGVYALSTEADITVNGAAAGDELGVGVANGDLNHDGVDDLIVGARHADPQGKVDAGETYVLFGPLSPGVYEAKVSADVTIEGINPDDKSGYGLHSGDANGDGIADLVVGAWAADPGGKLNAGQVYLFWGPLSSGVLHLSSDPDVTINGIAVEDHLGVDTALGDFDGDGVSDLLLGATEADPPGRDKAGQAYLVPGPLAAGIRELADLPHVTFQGAAPEDYFGIGLAFGDLNGDSLADLVFGAFRADVGPRLNAGDVSIIFGKCGGALPTIVGTNGDDLLWGTSGDDVMVGLQGADTIIGLGGADILCGGPGNDILVGGSGDDALFGGSGVDRIFCGSGSDTADGGSGQDAAAADCEVRNLGP